MELEHHRVLPADPGRVWQALTDIDRWDEWNPTLRDASAPLVPGTTVRMRLQLGPLRVPMRQQVLTVDAPHHLAWLSINGVPGFMDVTREFVLTQQDEQQTVLTQRESAVGPGTRLLMPLLRSRILAGYEALADGLTRHLTDDGATT